MAKALLALLCSILALFGVKAEGVIGTRETQEGDGRITWSSMCEVDPYYNYINYDAGEIGKEIATILIYETWDGEDDITVRGDWNE